MSIFYTFFNHSHLYMLNTFGNTSNSFKDFKPEFVILSGTELLSVLETVKKCVERGDMDTLIDAASVAVRARFVK